MLLLDLDVFGFGLAPLLFLSGCCFSGDTLSRSVLMFATISKRFDVVGLDTDSFTTLSKISFFWSSLPFTDACATELDLDDVLASDVLVTVAFDVTIAID